MASGSMTVSVLVKLLDQLSGPMRAARGSIAAASEELRKYKVRADAAFARGANLRQAAEGVQAFGQKVRAAIAVPIGAAEGFERQMSKLGAMSQATGGEFDLMREKAKSLGISTAWTASQAAEGMTSLAIAGFKTGEVMQAIEPMLNLASAAGTDLGETSKIAANMVRAFGLPASDTIRVADVMTKAFTTSNTTLLTLAESMKYVAPVAKTFGVSIEDTAAMTAMLGNVGIEGSMAGTALRTALSKLVAPRKMAGNILGEEGLDVNPRDAVGQLRPLADILAEIQTKTASMGQATRGGIIARIFGLEAMSGVMALMDQGAEKIRETGNTLRVSAGTSGQIAKRMLDNAAGAGILMESAIEGASISIGEVLLPVIKEFRLALIPMFEGIANWAKAHPRLTKAIMATAAALAIVTPLLAGVLFLGATLSSAQGIGLLAIGFSKFAVVLTKAVVPALIKTAAAMLANPIGLVIVAISAAVVAAIWFAKNWDKVVGVWERFKKASWQVKAAIIMIGAPIAAVMGPLLGLALVAGYIIRNWEPIKQWFSDFWESITAVFDAGVAKIEAVIGKLEKNSTFNAMFLQPLRWAGSAMGAVSDVMGSKDIEGRRGEESLTKGIAEVFGGYDAPKQEALKLGRGKIDITVNQEGRVTSVKTVSDANWVELDPRGGLAWLTP